MDKKRDNTSGRYVEKATLDDVLDVFDAVDGPPVVTSADVADAANLSRDSARRKLETLRDRGQVDKRKTAGRVLYWPTDHSERRERAENRIENNAADTTAKDDERQAGTEARRDDAVAREGGRDFDEILDGWPGAGQSKRDQRRAAGRAALEYLRRVGEATAADVKDAVEPSAPVDGQGPDTWWRKSARPAFKRAQDAGLVSYIEGSKVWAWDADDDQHDDQDDAMSGGVYDPVADLEE